MGNGTSRKKIAYQTKKQKEYILAYEKTDLVTTLHKAEKDALEKLQLCIFSKLISVQLWRFCGLWEMRC